jgi:hypothetical protein
MKILLARLEENQILKENLEVEFPARRTCKISEENSSDTKSAHQTIVNPAIQQ